MDEILKILERHPTWMIQVERMRHRGNGHPLDWRLRMKTAEEDRSRKDEYMAEVVVTEQCRQHANLDIIAHELLILERKIENATNPPTGDNIRQGT